MAVGFVALAVFMLSAPPPVARARPRTAVAVADRLELVEALRDEVTLVVGVEIAPQDLFRNARGEHRRLLVDLRHRLVARGVDVAQRPLAGVLRLLLGAGADAGG